MPLGFAHLVASLPAPPGDSIGPFRAYGLMIAIGVVVAVELSQRRWAARGGDADDISRLAMWVVPIGLIGTRAWHVMTDWKSYRGHWIDAVKIWEGGLGIPGGILFGVVSGVLVARHLGIRIGPIIDAVLPTVPLAQAIGRFGNWFNQELFGGPTDLPWGLEVDPSFRPPGYGAHETFHPTFLYEGLWNVALFVVLVRLDRTKRLRPGSVLPLYLAGYGLGRLWVENLRIDHASLLLGIRVNIFTSLAMIAIGLGAVALRGLRRRADDDDGPYVDGHVVGDDVGEALTP